jgi:signal transduction histidine kinase/ActR/RegA family two-component response regulator
VGLVARAIGQEAGKELQPKGLEQDFLLRVWDTAEGLLPTSVRSITQTRDGYVWLASFDGIVRFDGVQAVLFSGKNTPGLPLIPKTGKVFADSKGRLWAASTDGKVFSFDQISWREYRGDQGWPGFVVEGITENAAGRLVFSGAKSLVEFADGRFVPIPMPELPAKFRPPLKAVFDAQGKLWLTSPSHIWREDSGHWTQVCSFLTLGSPLLGVTPARDSGLWVATSQELRKYVADTPVQKLARPADFQRDDLELLEDFHGNLWAGSATNGLRIWMHDGRLVSVGAEADSLSPQVLSLFEDRERNVLVGTNGAGLARFKPRPFNTWFGQLGGLAGVLVNSVGEDSTGRILVGTEGSGLRWLRGSGQAGLIADGGVFGQKTRVTSLLHTRDGKMIAAVPAKGLFTIDGDTPVAIPAKPLEGELVRALFEDSHGRLWVGCDHGIVVRDHGAFTPISSGSAPVLTNVRGITEGPDGTVWFVGKEGLARFVGTQLELVTLPAVVPSKANLLSIFIDPAGVRWVGVESKGILRWQGENAFLFDSLHGLPMTSPGAFLEEADFLWASSEKGLVRIHRASLEAVATGKSNRLELQLFNRADGLPSDACRRAYQPTAIQSSDGHLWFSTHKGAISVRPKEIVTATYEPPAAIEEIRAEVKQIIVTPANQDHIDIPAGTRHMTIRCSVPSLGKPDYVRFQYKLEGFDNFWRDAGNERVIRFYDLQPGSYRFFVRAVGTDGRLVEKRSSITFIIHPFFWQQWWFRALCLAALMVGVGYVVWRSQQRHIRLREEKLREQEARAELEMQLQQVQKMDALGRLAGGIAHDFNNLLTSVGGNAELLSASLPAHSPQRELVDDISTAAGRARELVSQILTFSRQRVVEKVALDPAPVFREAVQLLRVGLPAMIELHAELPEKLPPILGDAAQLQRILLNLGTNAAHAIGTKTGHIWVRGEESEVTAVAPVEGVPAGRYVRLIVRDDGRGMDDKTLSRIFDPFFTTKAIGQGTGLGLSVVHGIVETYAGHIQVESQPSTGTIFRIYFSVTDQQPAPVAAQPELPVASTPAGEAVIMLVDDEAVVLKVTRAMLERLGYTVEGHTDSLAAVAAFTAAPERYRLLLTDYAMPKLDGVEMARAFWEIRPDLPAVLYSGYGGRLTSVEAERMGFVELLAKPFTLQMLEEAVARALKSSESAMAESRQA